jgi:hypothetical protein
MVSSAVASDNTSGVFVTIRPLAFGAFNDLFSGIKDIIGIQDGVAV